MPNHLHLIVSNEKDLAGVIRDFKRFTANKIVEQLIKFKRHYILNLLTFVGKQKPRQQHQVWLHANYAEGIESEEFFLQKLNYIHNNPVKRGFVTLQEHWIYSSAKNYLFGEDSVIEIDKIS